MNKAPSSSRFSLAIVLVVVLALVVLALVLVPGLLGTNKASQPTGATVQAGNYPKFGHAPDYSWVAGQVTFTRIQGGCVYVRTTPAPTEQPAGSASSTPAGPFVGTAVRSGTSPPLRDITPVTAPPAVVTPSEGAMFVPGGSGWDASKVKDGDYVVIFGHLAGPGEPREMCPGGLQYVIDRMQLNS